MVLLCHPLPIRADDRGVNTHASLVKSWKTFATFRIEGRRLVLRGDGWVGRVSLYMSDKSCKEVERVLRDEGSGRTEKAQTLTPKKASARR